MGQMTYALLLGTEIPEGADLYNGDGTGVMDLWKGRLNCPRHVVRWPEDSNLLGVVMAAGASGVDDTANLDTFDPIAISATERDETYMAAHVVALARWRAFAAWCGERGLKLPLPRVYLVRIEVA